MAHLNTVLGQMLQLLPRHVFDQIVATHSWAGPKPRKLTYWCQFVAMLFAQLSGCKSLRDIVFSLNQHVKKFYHLGLCLVKRSTLAEANEQWPAVIFEKLYQYLFTRVQQESQRQQKKSPKIKIIDSTTIDLGASVFPWAHFRSSWSTDYLPIPCPRKPVPPQSHLSGILFSTSHSQANEAAI